MQCPNCGTSVGSSPTDCPDCGDPIDADDSGWGIGSLFPSKKVPTGIKIICVLELIVLLPIVAGLMEYLGETGLALSDVGVLGAIAITIVGLRLLGVLGLLTMQSWGYKIAMGMYGLALFFGFTLLFVEPASGIAALLVYGVLAIYVHSKKRLYVPVKPGASI